MFLEEITRIANLAENTKICCDRWESVYYKIWVIDSWIFDNESVHQVRQGSFWQRTFLLIDRRHNYIQIMSKPFEMLKELVPIVQNVSTCINFPCISILTAMRNDLYETCGSQFGHVPRFPTPITSVRVPHTRTLKKKKKKQHRQCIVSHLFLSAGR